MSDRKLESKGEAVNQNESDLLKSNLTVAFYRVGKSLVLRSNNKTFRNSINVGYVVPKKCMLTSLTDKTGVYFVNTGSSAED